MDRKKFIQTIAPLGLSGKIVASKSFMAVSLADQLIRVPASLKPGDMIGITCPAGNISADEILPAVYMLEAWGFRIRIGTTVGKKDFSRGGTDAERLADIQDMLDDNSIRAVLCARGGYGSLRIIDRINFKVFVKNPKWIIGFSDITVLHSHINRQYGIATLHAKMCNSFPADRNKAEKLQLDSIESIRQCICGLKFEYIVSTSSYNRYGNSTAELVGGNLKVIESLSGSASDLDTENKILFLEDTGEYLYNIDRMFWNLKRSGKLSKLAGLLIGGFKIKPDDPGEEFGKTLEEIVLEKIQEYEYPVVFNFPVGHQKHNVALKCGVVHVLSVADNKVLLKEI